MIDVVFTPFDTVATVIALPTLSSILLPDILVSMLSWDRLPTCPEIAISSKIVITIVLILLPKFIPMYLAILGSPTLVLQGISLIIGLLPRYNFSCIAWTREEQYEPP